MEVFKPELSLFSPPEVQSAVVKGGWVDIYPSNSKLTSGPIEFFIVANEDYLDLNDTLLYITVRVLKDRTGAPVAAADSVALINMPLYSLFSDVEVYLNDTKCDPGDGMYAYNALFSNMLSYSSLTLNNQLISAGYAKDEAGKLDDKDNTGFQKRKSWNNGATFFGRLLCNVFQQERYMLDGVNVRIRLMRQKPEFAIMAFNADPKIQPVFEIIDARLSVRRVQVADYVRQEHEKALSSMNALYTFPLKVFNTFTIPKDDRGVIKENLFNGNIPKFLMVAMVSGDAFNGLYTKNPFNFVHNNVTKIGLYKNNEPVPFLPYEPDFEGNLFLREYMSIYMGCGMVGKDENLSFTYEDYPKGYTFFVFNLTPDLSLINCKPEKANLTLKMKFAKTLPEPTTIILYGLFDGLVQIDKNRIVYNTTIF